MGKTKDSKKRTHLLKTLAKVPENKIDYVQGIMDNIVSLINEENKTATKKKIDLSKFSGTIKVPKNFDAVAYQRKLRDEWD